jgi:hypothetical protein
MCDKRSYFDIFSYLLRGYLLLKTEARQSRNIGAMKNDPLIPQSFHSPQLLEQRLKIIIGSNILRMMFNKPVCRFYAFLP